MSAHLLEVRGLRTRYGSGKDGAEVVRGVSFHVDAGETLAMVGESGSGKSVTMLSVMRLLPEPLACVTAGEVIFGGRDLLRLDAGQMRAIRGRLMAMIFQDPMASLDPVFTIGAQMSEVLRTHDPTLSRSAVRLRVLELLDQVNIPNPQRVAGDYPHRLSGGMCQRVMLAIAISSRPSLLIADEPTTALDSTTQAQLLELVRRLQRELGMAMIWISHDLGVVAGLADRVQVMYAGQVVEQADVWRFYAAPRHPYSAALLECVPRLDRPRTVRLSQITGTAPTLAPPPRGCPFAPRCAHRQDRCAVEAPPLTDEGGDTYACWFPLAASARAIGLTA
jgi:oligopeptide transport system ATP-binding protein